MTYGIIDNTACSNFPVGRQTQPPAEKNIPSPAPPRRSALLSALSLASSATLSSTPLSPNPARIRLVSARNHLSFLSSAANACSDVRGLGHLEPKVASPPLSNVIVS